MPGEPDGWRHGPPSAVLVERMENMRLDLRRIEVKIDAFEREFSGAYVTQDEFFPIKCIAYGFVAVILLGFVGLLLHTVGWKPL